MPGQIRPNKQLAKIVYAILKTPKNMQQKTNPIASDKQKLEWFRDSSTAQ